MNTHRYLAPAKINLFLRVLRKREDGYHDILSVMQPVSLFDEIVLEMEGGKGIFVECDNKSILCDQTNLAYRAAEVFFKTAGISKKLSVKIKKNIPVAAGLGGGSSNAAAVLRALNEITSANMPIEGLINMAAGLGSDVPFFIVGKSCIARGRGEILESIELTKLWYILINPGFAVSTRWVYQNLNLTKNKGHNNINISKISLKEPVGIQQWQGLLANDLEEVTIGKHPEIKEIKDTLSAVGATGALMSGSGPTVFGIFPDKDKAEEAFGLLKGTFEQKRYKVFLAQGL